MQKLQDTLVQTDGSGATRVVQSHQDQFLERQTQEHVVALLWPLWVRRGLLVRALLIGSVLGAVIAFLIIPKRYVSTVQFLPPQDSSSSVYAMLGAVGGSGAAMNIASDMLGVKTSGAVFVAMLRSRTVQDDVVNEFNLRRVYHVNRQVDARKILETKTDVVEDHKSGVITLNVEDRDPKRAAAIAHSYVEYLNRVITQSTTSTAHRERVFLEERLQAVKQDLYDSEKKFSDFASNNSALDVKDEGRAMIESAASLQGQMIAEESELKGLQQIYAPDNYRIRAANARIAELKHQLNTLAGTSASSSGTSAASGSLYPSIRELPRLGVTWADLYRQTKIEEAVFETLTKQYELAKVQEAKEIPLVGVLDDAEIPEKKAGPPRIIITLCSSIVAFFLAIVYILANDAWRRVDPASPISVFISRVTGEISGSRSTQWLRKFTSPIRFA